MIHLPDVTALRPAERFALDLLVDQARLLPVRQASTQVVSLVVRDDDLEVPAASLASVSAFDVADGRVAIPRGLLRAVTAIASAEAEQRSDAIDRVGRVPGNVNETRRGGVDREPVVSLAACRLREAADRAAGQRPFTLLQPWPGGARWAVALSHDLDVVEWWPVFTGLRAMELVRKGEWKRLGEVVSALPRELARNPVASGLDRLIAFEQAAGVRATWFIICGAPSPRRFLRGDVTYRPHAPLVTRTLAALDAAGHEVGLHGSFATMDDGSAFRTERAHLARLADRDIAGVRQHFLRMRPGPTQRDMEAAGFTYDASFGFADGNGFRLGVADVVRSWDAARGASGTIDLVPLTWMDRALSKYRGVEDPELLVADALALADRCADVNGLWVGLWHPNLTRPLGYPGSEEAFHTLVTKLQARTPFIAPIGELVAWRQARRAAHALTLDPSGRPVWGGVPSSVRPPLEDRSGRAVEWA